MSKFYDNWTPKGAINSMIRRCRKHGVDDATIANLMILAVHELRAAQPGAPKAQSAVKTMLGIVPPSLYAGKNAVILRGRTTESDPCRSVFDCTRPGPRRTCGVSCSVMAMRLWPP